MNLIEVAHPVGALTPRDQADLAHDIVTGISGPSENVPESTLRRARAMTHVGFKELTGWVTGDLPWTPGATAQTTSRTPTTRTWQRSWRTGPDRPRLPLVNGAWTSLLGIIRGAADRTIGRRTTNHRAPKPRQPW